MLLCHGKKIYSILLICSQQLEIYYQTNDLISSLNHSILLRLKKWCLMILIAINALIGLFNSYINKNSKVLKYLSNACYPIYVIHMVILTSIGFIVIKFNINPILKFVVIVVLTYAISFLVYEVLRRTRRVGLLKNKPKTTVSEVTTGL